MHHVLGVIGSRSVSQSCEGLFRYREGHDVEPFGGVDVHGVDIRTPQTFDLLDGLNQEPVFEKRGSEPLAVDTCHLHPNPELIQRDTSAHSTPIDHEVGTGQEPTIPYRPAMFGY